MSIADKSQFRHMVMGLLGTLSSEAEQREYQRNVPYVEVGLELQCQWFDDLYHPEDYEFRSIFSAEELGAMAEFNTIFSQRKSRLPPGGIVMWYAYPVWQGIGRAAAVALRAFQPKSP